VREREMVFIIAAPTVAAIKGNKNKYIKKNRECN
jgi:hypothetical protein